jgi:nucleotide sugar dehydrogenase
MQKHKKTKKSKKSTVGFIGQGFIGKNMADDVERRGFTVIRYALEKPYVDNKDAIATADIVFIAVPTPTTPTGFSDKMLRAVLPLVGKGKIAVVKSTILPGTTESLQKAFPHCMVFHSPEFLREKTAAYDAQNPSRNIVGIPKNTKKYKDAAKLVLSVLPKAPYEKVCASRDAEFIKYGGNSFLTTKVIFMNMLYDMVKSSGGNYDIITEAMSADERIGTSHMKVVDNSGHKGARKGRGAGGHCFHKDFAALREHAVKKLGHTAQTAKLMKALEEHNLALLLESGKDMDLLRDIYGDRLSRLLDSSR